VLTLSKIAAKEAGPRGVRVNAICPGLTDTPMLARSFDDRPESTGQIAAAIPLGRLGEPVELANAILWLCSDDSSFTNGVGLVVDGGRTA
jgi:NAD(P)-dependent dehydrogenase (short-subunit alcohol dehydrogenase family)